MLGMVLPSVLLLLAFPTQAATFKWVSDSPIGCTLKISGPIEAGDAERLKGLLGNRIGSQERICFDSPGGPFAEGIRLAETIFETA